MALSRSFPQAVKNRHLETIRFFLTHETIRLPAHLCEDISKLAFKTNNHLLASEVFAYTTKNKLALTRCDQTILYRMLTNAPHRCIPIMLASLVNHTTLTYQGFFHTITRIGSIDCANEFIHYIKNLPEMDDESINKLLMDCMLQGFATTKPLFTLSEPFNLNHEMVSLQVTHYLQCAAFNNYLETGQHAPSTEAIDAIVNIIVTTQLYEYNKKLLTPCFLVLHTLINHPLVTEDKRLATYCLQLATEKALVHPEHYYLQALLRAGVTLNFTKTVNGEAVNGILITNISSESVKSLVWLAKAIAVTKSDSLDEDLVNECLKKARPNYDFNKQFFAIINGTSIPINHKQLALLAKYLGDHQWQKSFKKIIAERIQVLTHDAQQSLPFTFFGSAKTLTSSSTILPQKRHRP